MPITKAITKKKAKGNNKLTSLAQSLEISAEGAHNALCDVRLSEQVLLKLKVSEKFLVDRCEEWKIAMNKKTKANLIPLNNCTSQNTRNKLAEYNIDYDMIVNTYKEEKVDGLKAMLSIDENNKVRVTKSSAVINKIVKFLDANILI